MKRFISLILLPVLAISFVGCKSPDKKTVEAEFFINEYHKSEVEIKDTETEDYHIVLPDSKSFLYEDICFLSENRIPSGSYDFSAVSAACYDIENAEIIYAKDIFSKVYPASTTKLLTAYVAVKYADLDDIAVIKKDNCGITTPGAQLCGFKAGDKISMRDLLYCLLVFSGNDAGVAIAEHISGSVDEYCKLMNRTALDLGASDTHFTNPHGLHDINHYTTAYDIYMIFNECLKVPFLKEVFKCKGYSVSITDSEGIVRSFEVEPTNQYARGITVPPEGITVYGGKTGETLAAKNCLILYSEDSDGYGFITELFASADRPTVYSEMNILLDMCLKH